MEETFRFITVICSVLGFGGMLVLIGHYVMDHDRRVPLPIALGIYLFCTAQYNATHMHKRISPTTVVVFAATVLALWAVGTTGLWGRPNMKGEDEA